MSQTPTQEAIERLQYDIEFERSPRNILVSKADLATLLSSHEKLVEGLTKLANASDEVGIQFFDTDDMDETVWAMQTATQDARALLKELGQ